MNRACRRAAGYHLVGLPLGLCRGNVRRTLARVRRSSPRTPGKSLPVQFPGQTTSPPQGPQLRRGRFSTKGRFTPTRLISDPEGSHTGSYRPARLPGVTWSDNRCEVAACKAPNWARRPVSEVTSLTYSKPSGYGGASLHWDRPCELVFPSSSYVRNLSDYRMYQDHPIYNVFVT